MGYISSVSPSAMGDDDITYVTVQGDFDGPAPFLSMRIGAYEIASPHSVTWGDTDSATFRVSGIPVGSYALTLYSGGSLPLTNAIPGGTFSVYESSVTPTAPAPVIYSVSPAPDPAGGTLLNVTGANFQTGAVVRIDGVIRPSTVLTGASATVTAQAHTPGTVVLTLTNPDGQSAGIYITYPVSAAPAPTFTSITPGTIGETGGPATITGTGFQTGATVTVCGKAATNVVVVSATQISLTLPANPTDDIDYCNIVITNPDGQFCTGTNAIAYTDESLPAPTIAGTGGITPDEGIETGGTTVTITGTGFQPGATVTFDGINATNVVYGSATTLTCKTPAHAPGLVDVTVTNPDTQSVTETDGYTYIAAAVNPPSIANTGGISPTSGSESGGTTVTITGTDFVTGAVVYFCGIAAATTFVSSTSLTAVTPAHAPGTCPVSVRNPDGQIDTAAEVFTYITNVTPAPTISGTNGIVPDEGPVRGGTTVTITGTGFQAGVSVTFDGLTAPLVSYSATVLKVISPAHALGPVDVVVTNPDTQSVTAEDGFTYIPNPPVITDISPDEDVHTGTPVTITGTDFDPDATVTVCGVEATDVDVVSSTEIVFIMPDGITPGNCDVTVTNPDGQFDTVTGGIEVIPKPGPDITDVSPDEGVCSGGTLVMLTGTGFEAGLTVTVCGVQAEVLKVTPTYILFLTPVLTEFCMTDGCDIVVTNPDGMSDTVPGGFTPVKESEMYDTCPLKRQPSQTVLTGLKVIRKKGEMTAVLPLFDSLKDALENCLQPGDFYRTSAGVVMIVPHLDYAPEDGV